MIHLFTRIASLTLAFGFFISCSTLQSSDQDNQASRDLSEKEIQQQLDSLNAEIDSGKNVPNLYYQKGFLLTKIAQTQDEPAQRTGFYTEAYQALTQAADLYKNTPGINSEKAEELLNVTWSNEHNQGVQILQSDTSKKNPDYTRAAAHFKNATIVIPDSAISYKMGARAYYKNKQPQKAIDVLQNARQNISNIPASFLEQLAFLYLENDQQQKAVEIYEQAESFSDQNLNLLHGLANAYINTGQHQKAVELLEQLSTNEPENVIYGQSLAMELYFTAAEKLETITSNLRQGNQVGKNLLSEVDSLLLRAEDQFKRILDKKPKDQDLKLSFGTFYQNSASKYQKLLPFVEQQQKNKLDKKVNQYIFSSIPLFEQLAEEKPDNQQIWHNLYQAYSYLGMEEKAQKAKSNL
jgi:predicted Zn-dependent protease